MSEARSAIWQGLLKSQIFLSKHIGITPKESDSMVYFEFKSFVRLSSEYLKEIGPQLSDLG